MSGPTPEDMARDLAADLGLAERVVECIREVGPPYVARDRMMVADWMEQCIGGWPAALRRALAAEAEADRPRAMYVRAMERIAAQSELLSRRAERDQSLAGETAEVIWKGEGT